MDGWVKPPVGGGSRDLGAPASLCDCGLLTAPLWASAAESTAETAGVGPSWLGREAHANEYCFLVSCLLLVNGAARC